MHNDILYFKFALKICVQIKQQLILSHWSKTQRN